MKRKIFLFNLFACAALLFTACSSVSDSTEGGKYADRSTFAKGEIKLPANYNKDNFRKILLGVVVQNVKIDPNTKKHLPSANPAVDLSTRLQTEMVKLKRFSVFSAFNRGGVNVFRTMEDVGDAKMPENVDMRALDLVLTLNLMLSLEKHERHSDNLLIYEVQVDANLENLRTHESVFAEKAKGVARRVEKISLRGERMGGYKQDDIRQAFLEASLQAIAHIANKLGNTYPVGGRITGILGENMQMDKGFEQGVGGDMQMTVYAVVNGVDLPLGIAEAHPGKNTSNLTVWRWNTDNKYAARIIKDMQEDLNWAKKNECYAVSLRMAVPPEWSSGDMKTEDRTK